MKKTSLFIVLIFISLFTNGCSTKDDDNFVRSIFQSNGATVVREHTTSLQKSLVKYYDKLNKRNPNHSSKENTKRIIKDINSRVNTVKLELLRTKKATYQDYLNIAFSPAYVKNRNDYLMAGMYKMLYWAYTIERTHTVTTLQYDVEKIQQANKMMQVIQYKIQTQKDKDGNFLYITWQRPWQLELLKKTNKNKKVDMNKYSSTLLMHHSNMSYQIITKKMIFSLGESLRYLGSESTNLSVDAIKSVFIFL